MAQGNSFKHISVSAAEDDIVIRAGLPSIEEGGNEAGDSDAQIGRSAQVRASGPEEERADAAGGRRSEMSRLDGRTRRDAAIPSQTLEDLRTGPMPLVQRIVIIAAIILIIGALVYYLVAMR